MNKQIEEMTNCLCDVLDFDYDDEIGVTKVDAKTTAEALYNAGYRKASDVAADIFADIEKYVEVALMNGHIETPILCIGHGTFAELKKKYLEGQK